MHRDQNLNRPPVTFYDKIANKAVLMCVIALPVRELKLTLQICRLGWKTRQGSNVSSSQRGQRQWRADPVNNGDRRQRERDFNRNVIQQPNIPPRTLPHPQTQQDGWWKQDKKLSYPSLEIPRREWHFRWLPRSLFQGPGHWDKIHCVTILCTGCNCSNIKQKGKYFNIY